MSKSDQSSNYPNPPHPHAELIKAWADGAEIQCVTKMGNISVWLDVVYPPTWNVTSEYRIKPTPAPKKYFRVFEVTWRDGRKSLATYPKDYPDLDRILAMSNVRPVSDWTEYE